MADTPFDLQLLNACAALLLLLSFSMLSQRRIVTLVNLLAMQGALLFVATLLLAWRTGQNHLYVSAALTLALKVVLLPWLLHRMIRRLEVYWDTEPLLIPRARCLPASSPWSSLSVSRNRSPRWPARPCATRSASRWR